MSRVLITGVNGLLGQALLRAFINKNEVLATGLESEPFIHPDRWKYTPLDIGNMEDCKTILQDFIPDIILNAASYTNVDGCEREKELCWQVNVKGVENLAQLARRYNSHLVHYSTDYVFDGTAGPYGEEDRQNPLGYYGKSKLASENVLKAVGCEHTILRTNVLYGTGRGVKKNFFLWVLENLQSGTPIKVVTDQYNNPTLAEDLAAGTTLAAARRAGGLFHVAGKEYMSRHEFALAVADIFELSRELISPVRTAELHQAADRPLRGGLKIERAVEKLQYNPKSVDESLFYLKWKMKKNG